jgi:hypothetical protein
MDSILVRIDRTVESMLENESLTADLNDEAAKVLIDWSIARTKEIVLGTIEIIDDELAEEAMYGQLRALRRLMRTINRWAYKVAIRDLDYGESALERIIRQAGILYGTSYIPPDETDRKRLLNQQINLLHAPASYTAKLLRCIENAQPPV